MHNRIETPPAALQPDQSTDRWDDHVCLYEAVFETFSLSFARHAITSLKLWPRQTVLDVAAGSGGAALELARAGHRVTAIDGAAGMVARMKERVQAQSLHVDAQVMDGQELTFADNSFDAALSVFGVILFPDAVRGLAEMRRVVKPGGRVALVTWTEPQNYELASAVRGALMDVMPGVPTGGLPAQLRFKEHVDCCKFFKDAGFDDVTIERQDAVLEAPSAKWLAERLAFAPGMAAMIEAAGAQMNDVVAKFQSAVESIQGKGAVRFRGVAFVASATVTKA